MAESSFYTKSEVDDLITDAKTRLLKQIEEAVTVGTNIAPKPTMMDKTLSIQILRTESE